MLPCSCAACRAAASASTQSSPTSSSWAPSWRSLSALAALTVRGRKMRTGTWMPRCLAAAWAACSMASAWLPVLAATTPRCSSSSVRANSLWAAPRALKLPVACLFSSFKCTVLRSSSACSASQGAASSGVS